MSERIERTSLSPSLSFGSQKTFRHLGGKYDGNCDSPSSPSDPVRRIPGSQIDPSVVAFGAPGSPPPSISYNSCVRVRMFSELSRILTFHTCRGKASPATETARSFLRGNRYVQQTLLEALEPATSRHSLEISLEMIDRFVV